MNDISKRIIATFNKIKQKSMDNDNCKKIIYGLCIAAVIIGGALFPDDDLERSAERHREYNREFNELLLPFTEKTHTLVEKGMRYDELWEEERIRLGFDNTGDGIADVHVEYKPRPVGEDEFPGGEDAFMVFLMKKGQKMTGAEIRNLAGGNRKHLYFNGAKFNWFLDENDLR